MINTLLIVNPRAGKMKAKGALLDVINVLCGSDHRVTVEVTRHPRHASELSKELGGQFDKVICIGGDGTLNEVIDGLTEGGHKPLVGYIPAGTTNDFASTLGLPKDVIGAAEIAAAGTPKQIDIGIFNGRIFSYIASFGAFTSTSYTTPQGLKNALGHLAYMLKSITDIPTIKGEKVKVTTDSGAVYDGEFIFGAVSNTTSVAGFISLKKHSVTMNDGLHELLMVRKPDNIIELNKCVTAILNQNYDSELIIFDNIKSAEFETANPLSWSLDGERADTDGFVNISNIHCAVNIMLPENTDSNLIK